MEELRQEVFERIALRLKAMGNPFRLRILHSLHDGELSVNEIMAKVGGSQANVSKHLNLLRTAELVKRRRDGVSAYYRISDQTVFGICEAVCDSLLDRAKAEAALLSEVRDTMAAGDSETRPAN